MINECYQLFRGLKADRIAAGRKIEKKKLNSNNK